MKKIMMMAVMLVASATAFAKDSDALKAILNAKTYAEAETLLKSSLDQLASPAEKAEAYNKLVDLAMAVYDEQDKIKLANQFKKDNPDPVDEKLMAEMACNGIAAAYECEKYDQQPNEKGKVKPRFGKKNAERLWATRNQLFNSGQAASKDNEDALVLKYWGTFTETLSNPFFAEQMKAIDALDEKAKKDNYDFFGQVAYFAGRNAEKLGELAKARSYYSIVAKNIYVDEKFRDDARNKELTLMREGLKDKADSLRVLEEYKDMYTKAPDDDLLMNALYTMYRDLKDKDNMYAVLDARLAKDPNNFMALANRGLAAMEENDAAKGIEYLEKAVAVQPENVAVLHWLGVCYNAKAGELSETDKVKSKELFKKAIDVFDKCKALDPENNFNWAYSRFQAYYNFYGPDAPETKQAEADSK